MAVNMTFATYQGAVTRELPLFCWGDVLGKTFLPDSVHVAFGPGTLVTITVSGPIVTDDSEDGFVVDPDRRGLQTYNAVTVRELDAPIWVTKLARVLHQAIFEVLDGQA